MSENLSVLQPVETKNINVVLIRQLVGKKRLASLCCREPAKLTARYDFRIGRRN